MSRSSAERALSDFLNVHSQASSPGKKTGCFHLFRDELYVETADFFSPLLYVPHRYGRDVGGPCYILNTRMEDCEVATSLMKHKLMRGLKKIGLGEISRIYIDKVGWKSLWDNSEETYPALSMKCGVDRTGLNNLIDRTYSRHEIVWVTKFAETMELSLEYEGFFWPPYRIPRQLPGFDTFVRFLIEKNPVAVVVEPASSLLVNDRLSTMPPHSHFSPPSPRTPVKTARWTERVLTRKIEAYADTSQNTLVLKSANDMVNLSSVKKIELFPEVSVDMEVIEV